MPAPPHIFTAGTAISPTEVNANFDVLNDCMDASGGEVSGNILPNTTNSRNLGSASQAFANVFTYVLKLLDTNASHTMSLAVGSDLTANRTLTLTTGDASRTLTIGADSSISGTAHVSGGTDIPLADGGTGASLADPGADRVMFWDDSAGAVTWLTMGTNLSITGTTLDSTGGLTLSSTDNRVVRVDGTTGIQGSAVTIDDSANVSGVATLAFTNAGVFTRSTKATSTIYQAATDGFVTVYMDGVSVGGVGSCEIRTDSNATPTTIEGRISCSNDYNSVTVPVRKNDYYRAVLTTDSGTVTTAVKWVANGTVG